MLTTETISRKSINKRTCLFHGKNITNAPGTLKYTSSFLTEFITYYLSRFRVIEIARGLVQIKINPLKKNLINKPINCQSCYSNRI